MEATHTYEFIRYPMRMHYRNISLIFNFNILSKGTCIVARDVSSSLKYCFSKLYHIKLQAEYSPTQLTRRKMMAAIRERVHANVASQLYAKEPKLLLVLV